ncbi:MAG: DNA sulfur modification protein DndD [Chroococcidiopsidaceae cyanobacterium CP_BM_RX_35]|nr:DNA sulfur modification protein DndD [Chroococcidiopsidaceae cyanobacterium CP_BM_RX_35]
MIFHELVLQNFGPYQGRQVIDLSPGDGIQNIVLLGGMNGGGKTTLIDAIRLALYGHRAPCSTRGNLSYGEFLHQCVSRPLTNEATCIELVFQQMLNSELLPNEFRIRRTWTQQPRNGRDNLEILADGQIAPALAKAWDERIEDLLPLGISNLFLFDGEQVKELAEQDSLPPVVVNAIRALLGLELPDRLSSDLDVLVTRKRKALANSQELKKLEEIEKNLAAQEQERQAIKKHVAAILTELEGAEEKERQATAKFLSDGGRIAGERTHLAAQLQQMKADAETQCQILRELAAGVLPLVMICPLLKDAHIQASTEVRYQQFQVAEGLLQERSQRLLNFVTQLNWLPEQVNQIQTFLAQEDEVLSQLQGITWLNTELDSLHHLTNVLEHGLPTQLKFTQERLATLHLYQEAIDSTERYLATAASPEVYDKLMQEVRQAQTEVAQLKTVYEQAKRQYEQLVQVINYTKQDLFQYSELTIERKNNQHILTAVTKVRDTLQLFEKKLKLRKLNQLETLVTECFLYLLHKSNLVHRVQIDTQTFNLSLFNYDGHAVPKHRLSAGEKQLLAIALLWGLARASRRQLPIAIDTPLGRLDSSHRSNLVERYFPQASHQVLLLSTDTEICKAEVERLRAKEVIAHEYLLVHDSTNHQTKVKPGYFW